MSRPDGDGPTQSRENVRQPGLRIDSRGRPVPPQARASRDSDDVSPRLQGEFTLNEKPMEQRRRQIEEAKRKARESITLNVPSCNSEPARPAGSSAAAASKSTQSALNCVSPELLAELRKIIRDEFELLNRGNVKEDLGEKIPRPPAGRDRSTSPVLPFGANPPTNTFSSNDSDDRKPSPTTGAPSPTKSQQRSSPRQSTVRFSDETKPAVTPRADRPCKSSPAEEVELTAIDKKWGALFDSNGTHTKRMEHVMRGLANYIIEEFLPQKSIVITPEKMASFYSHHRLEKEKFLFAALFRSKYKGFNEALATLYEDLGCQYFLVQAGNWSRPTVPSLTPNGFMHWLVTMIQAYPDEEARRLDKVVSALPIEADSLLDGKPERLPKQISRYLLPKEALRNTRRLVDETMKDFQEDIEGSSTSRSKGSTTSSSSNTSASKLTPIVVTATAEKRPSMSANSSHNSRYVPEVSSKEARIDEPVGSGYERDRRTSTAANSNRDLRADDMNRRNSMPAPPLPNKLGRSGSVAEGARTSQNSREAYGSSTTGASSKAPAGSSSSSSRKHRSPQRNHYSQSVPAGLERHEPVGDRFRSSAISAAAANVAATVLGAFAHSQSSQNPSSSTATTDSSIRDLRSSSEQYRDKRASMEDSAPRAPASSHGLRDKVDMDGNSTSRSSKRRSMVMPDVRGATWDDYLKSSAPRSATPSLSRRDGGYGSSG